MAYIQTTSETKTDVNLLVEIDVNAYNEIEVDIKRSGLCVLNDGCGLSGNRSNECGNTAGFRSVVKRSLTLEKEVSRLKWREEYLTVCEDGNIYNAQNCRTASVSSMKNEASKQCLNEINNKQKCFRENSESPKKSKDYKGMYLVASSNISHAQETQEAAFYMETQGNNDRTTCQQRFEENDPLPDKLYKDKTDASYALRSQPEEVTMRTCKKKRSKGISADMQNLHSVSYPQNQMNYTKGVNVENKLNDATAKSVIIEEIGKKLIQFLGSAAGQKLMMEYSNGKQKSGNSLSSGNLLDSVFSLDMERIKMIVDEICNALQTQSSVTLDEDSSKLQQNPQERNTTNKFFPKECFLTERSKLPANNTDEQRSRKKECSGVVSNKSERKIHRLNLKQCNRLHRNRYNVENNKRKGNTEGFHKQGISVNSSEARGGLNNPVSSEKMESGIKSIFLTVKETFNALLKNKLFEICTEKNRSSAQNKVEHQSVRVEGRLHRSVIPQRGEHSNTAAKCKNGTISIEKGSHLSPRKLINISEHTQAATHTKTLQNLENLACEYGITKQRKEIQMPYSATPPKSDKTKKWRKDNFQKLLFELLETLCSKIKKKDLQRLSILLDILMKLQDKNIASDVETGNITKMVACYNIKQHTKDSTRECSTRQLHTITSRKESVADGTIENKQYDVCKTFYKETNSVSAKNYKKCIQTNLAHNCEIRSEKNSIKKQVHTKFVANTSQFRTLQTNIQSKTDTLPVSNMCSDYIHLEEDLKTSLNHVNNKINDDCIDCTQLVENCGTETMLESENQKDSDSRKLLPHFRVRDQRQNTLEDHNLATKEGKTIDNFLSLMRTSGENQSYNHFSPSVLSWQRMDGKIKCPIHQREDSCEYSHEPAANPDKINKSVTIMGLSEAYEMYNRTPSDVHLQRTNNKSKHSEKQICTQVHKIADVSSSLYKHAALTHDSSDVSVNKINGVGVKFNMPFSGEVIFPKTTECYKHSLKIGKTVKFYIPFRINRNNCMQLTLLESENKESRHVFENEKDKSVTDEEEINLMKEECTDDKKCVPNSCFLTSDECFSLQKALLHSVLLEHPQSNEQKLTVCQSIDYEESRCDKVESNGVLHETSSILLIESTAGKQASHTNNCYSFQYIHKPMSPWKLEEQVGSFMFGAYTKRQFPVKSSFCMEDDLDSLKDHIPDLPQRNLESPCSIKTCDIKIIRESRELDQEIPKSRKTITEQLPTYFVFSAHNINTSKEKMQSHITRKTKKRNRNINDPQSSRLNEQTVDNYASYYQRPSICLEPTICSYDPGSQAAVEYPDDKNNNTQNKRAKRNKVLHYHDFCTSNSLSKLEKRKPIYSSVDFKNGINGNVVPVEPTTSTVSQNPIKSLDQDSDINLNTCPSNTENKFDTDSKCIEKNDVLNRTSHNLPYQLDEEKLFSSSVELNDDSSVYKIPFESITNTPMQQSVESLASDRKLDVSSSDSNQVQNIDHKETNHKKIDHKETERNDDLSYNDFQTSHFTSKLEEKKSNALSVRFKNDQRERVYPLETSSDTSEEHFKVRHMESDYFPAKKSEKKHNIFSSDNEESSSNNDDSGLPKKNGYFGEESSNKRNIKTFERVQILSQIDANDMVKQAAPEEATNPNNVPSRLVSENSERDQHCSVSLNPDNITVCKDLPSTSVYNKKNVVAKDSLMMIKNRDVKGHSSDSVSMHSRKQSRVSRIFQKIFPKNNNNDESILGPLGVNADFQSFSTSNQFETTEQQNTNIKETETTAVRSSGSEYDRWRLSQTKRLLKTHHALIKEAHDLGHTMSETGESDASVSEEKTSKIKIGQSTWNACTPADFLLHFRRGFRDDQMTLNNKVCFVERLDLLGADQENNHEMIDLMITCHPLDFLVKLGYSAEEAALISQDEEIKCRLYAAIREARIWANAITKPQAALLYLLAHKAKPKIMRYYLCLVESVINRRITNAVKLNELIDFLECLEDGEIALKDVFEDMAESDAMEERKKTEDLYMVFHHMAEEEAMNCGRYPLSAKQMFLLQTLVSKYHIALQDHLALLTRYIGRGLIKNTVQLEAALVYLPHVGKHSVNIKEFEEYCGIKSKKKIETRNNS